MLDKLKMKLEELQKTGVPLLFIRDPKTGMPSVSLTLMIITFAVCTVGLVGKISDFLGDVDMTQAITLFGLNAGLYFARASKTQAGGGVEVSTDVETK